MPDSKVGPARILAVNPGGMTTRIAVYDGEERVFDATVEHTREELAPFGSIPDQLGFRRDAVERALERGGQLDRPFDAVVGRGGLLRPIPSGAYEVTPQMLEDARVGYQGQHASNLGPLLADALSKDLGGRAFIVDPVSVDEFDGLARYSGHRDIERKSLGHALNTKATARKAAARLGRSLDSINLIVAHLGSGISITPLRKGRMIDVNNAASGGPFSPERTGGLPLVEMLDFMAKNGIGTERMKQIVTREGGLISYLGSNDFREAARRMEDGDEEAAGVVRAMAYQIAKETGAMAAALAGDVQAVVLTGSLAYSELLVDLVRERVGFIADVMVLPGENELESLALGVLGVVSGSEEAREYPRGPGRPRRQEGAAMKEQAGAAPPRSFEELMERALEYGRERGPARLGVAAAWDPVALEAVEDARRLELIEPVLVGDGEAIAGAAREAGVDVSGWEHVEADGDIESARKAVQLVRTGDVDFLMKGKVNTADIMRAALDKENGIRSGRLMSHIAVMWTPTFGRLLCMSDGGIVPSPTLEQKADIIRNAVDAMHKLGWELPKVAVVGALEKVNPALPHTVDAAELAKMNARGEITGCIVDGPFGFDNAVSEVAAARKGVDRPIAGKADLVIFGDIDVGNVFFKAMSFMTDVARTAGVLIGAAVPIVMPSRADGPETKRNSIVVGTVIAHAQKS